MKDPELRPLQASSGPASAAVAVSSPADICNVWCGESPAATSADAGIQAWFRTVKAEMCSSFRVL
jgi:hypothetical protein